MSEPDRQRRERIELRLAELTRKHGELPDYCPPLSKRNPDPSWGPVGSLAASVLEAAVLEHLLAQHRDMLAAERARRHPESPPNPVRIQSESTPKPATPEPAPTQVHVV